MNINGTDTISVELTEQLQKRMRFIAVMQQIMGVLTAISGALTCLGIITAIIGIPCLIAGIKLFQSGSAFSKTANLKRSEDLVDAINNLHYYWKLLLIYLILSIIMVIILFIFLFSFLAMYSQGRY